MKANERMGPVAWAVLAGAAMLAACGDATEGGVDAALVDGASGPDAGAHDAALIDGAAGAQGDGGTAGAPECVSLEGCCDELTGPTEAGCRTVVELDMGDLCADTYLDYQAAGWCIGGTSCDELGGCCPSLMPGPGWRETCESTVYDNNEIQCARVLESLRDGGYCW